MKHFVFRYYILIALVVCLPAIITMIKVNGVRHKYLSIAIFDHLY
jgi:uncharacterized membrane protein YdbT with pleckstrin-like domain